MQTTVSDEEIRRIVREELDGPDPAPDSSVAELRARLEAANEEHREQIAAAWESIDAKHERNLKSLQELHSEVGELERYGLRWPTWTGGNEGPGPVVVLVIFIIAYLTVLCGSILAIMALLN